MYKFIAVFFNLKPKSGWIDRPEPVSYMINRFTKIAGPATMQGLLLQCMVAIDLIMVGALGPEALAAVGIMGQPEMMMLVMARSLGIALTALVARRHGEKDYVSMNSILKQGILLTLCLYIPFLLICYIFLPHILMFTGAESSYIDNALSYGRWIVVSLLFQSLSITIGANFIGIGYTKIIFKANALGNILNTVLNVGLIYGLGPFPTLGVMGAGISTCLSSAVIFSILLGALYQGHEGLSFKGDTAWIFTRDTLHSILHISSSSFGEQFFERLGMYLYTMVVASLGAIALATHQICMNLLDIFYYFAMGISYASMAQTGHYLGKKRPDLAEAYGSLGGRIGLLMGIFGLVLFLGGNIHLMEIYTHGSPLDHHINEIILLMALVSIPQCLQMAYSGVLKGAGDTAYVMKYSLLSIAIIRPIITYVLCVTLGFGLLGAWIALVLDQSLRFIASYTRFYQGTWKLLKI